MQLRIGESYRIENDGEVIEFKVYGESESHYRVEMLESNIWIKGSSRLINKRSKFLDTSKYLITHISAKPDPSLIDLYIEMALQTRDKDWFNELISQKGVLA